MLVRDDIHYNFKKVDSYNKPYVMVQSARELGKSTALVLDKAWAAFKKYGYCTVAMRYKIVDITDAYIKSIQYIINMFDDEEVTFTYAKSSIKDGVVYIYVDGKLFLVLIALNIDINRVKSLVLPSKLWIMFLDEYVLNPKFKEKYIPGLWDRIAEVYNTFYRFRASDLLKTYFIGNTYSRYNPIHEHFRIPYKDMIPGCILVGEDYVYQAAKMSDELYAKIIKSNPLYIRDNEYKEYALGGIAINDQNIKLGKLQNNYKLYLVVDFGDDLVGIYKNTLPDDSNRFYCGEIKYDNINRDIYCFDFQDLVEGNTLYSNQDAFKFEMLKAAMRKNKVEYKDIAVYYKMVELYNVR